MRSAFFLLLLALIGCSSSPTVDPDSPKISGTIKMDNTPLPNATVTFIPVGSTKGFGGSGVTGPDGKYQLAAPMGKAAMPDGEYKVTVSRRLNPDGSEADPNISPIESPATEVVATTFSQPDQTKLTATVTKGSQTIDFEVKPSPFGKKKR